MVQHLQGKLSGRVVRGIVLLSITISFAILASDGFASPAKDQSSDLVFMLRPGTSEPTLPPGVFFVCTKRHPATAGACAKAPHPKHTPDPDYTDAARHARIEGKSVFWTIVGTDGVPREVYFVKTLGYGLDAQAVSAVRHWKFSPATLEGKPVPVAIQVQMNFHLR
jgi:TonB family protein